MFATEMRHNGYESISRSADRPTRRRWVWVVAGLVLVAPLVYIHLENHLPYAVSIGKSLMFSFIYGPPMNPVVSSGGLVGPRARLRRKWHRAPRSFVQPLTAMFNRSQHPTDCSAATFASYEFAADQGMGVNLFIWADTLCEASVRGSVFTTYGPWLWRDAGFCGTDLSRRGAGWWRRLLNLHEYYPDGRDALECYFGPRTNCPLPATPHEWYLSFDEYSVSDWLFRRTPLVTRRFVTARDPSTLRGGGVRAPACMQLKERRAAGMELLFQRLPSRLIEELGRASYAAFGPSGAPEHMVAVHIRWGDKGRESPLVGMERYVAAVRSFMHRRRVATPVVFVMTEDPKALEAFIHLAPRAWHVHHHAQAVGGATLSGTGQGMLITASTTALGALTTGGALGRHSLLALLLSLEARHFVLTASSHWSDLVDYLRRTRVDAECDRCTSVEWLGEKLPFDLLNGSAW